MVARDQVGQVVCRARWPDEGDHAAPHPQVDVPQHQLGILHIDRLAVLGLVAVGEAHALEGQLLDRPRRHHAPSLSGFSSRSSTS